ncbi:sensor domain-containing diguanylate cyclase [Arcobacter roscoffensis]|uniref:diguanylate cyclase n=1 Tax=Arcobacter roscoffensis TaxID=2961520 RepID=A0ABY5E2T0_9BACT|nr:sensor domain-containing diguanylate cyclase [Arcobacter roscoffensis]UTJ06030.1 sensor domain-containing diguanylate cyclase [Arcobacter roscoffensis]
MDCKEENNKLSIELESFKTLINETGAYVYTKDLYGKYTFANSLVLSLFEKSLDEVIGKDDTSFFDLNMSNELKKNDSEVLVDGKIIEKEEINYIKETKEERIYWTVKKPLYNKEGNIIGMCGISTDITQRKKLELELEEKTKLLNTILDNVDAYIYMKDENRKFKYVNSKVANLFGYEADYIIGKKDIEVLNKDVAESFWEMDKKVFESNKSKSQEELYFDDEGNERHYWSKKIPFKMQGDDFMSLIGLSTDITELQQLKDKLKKQSITDYLTKANNRRYFVQQAKIEFKKSIRHKLDLSILILDVDWFKKVNDTYGHLIGDKVLIEIVKLCKKLKRQEDTFCRIGGEEFAFILPCTNIVQAEEFAYRLKEFQEKKPFKNICEDDINITFSMGISSYYQPDESYESIFSRADDALYEAKESGRNKVCIK